MDDLTCDHCDDLDGELDHISKHIELLRRYVLSVHENERLQKLLAFYMGEGEKESPDEKEYRELASIPTDNRTEEQTARLMRLAKILTAWIDSLDSPIPNGAKIIFIKPAEFQPCEWGLSLEEYDTMLSYRDKDAKIVSNDSEGYYTIKFEDGYTIHALSEFHIRRVQ